MAWIFFISFDDIMNAVDIDNYNCIFFVITQKERSNKNLQRHTQKLSPICPQLQVLFLKVHRVASSSSSTRAK